LYIAIQNCQCKALGEMILGSSFKGKHCGTIILVITRAVDH
jgi:hypothetical protein